MNVFSYPRLQQLYQLLSNQPYTSMEQLSQTFHVSARTLRNDLHVLKSELAPYGLLIQQKRGYGYTLVVDDAAKSQQLRSDLQTEERASQALSTPEERLNALLYLLLTSNHPLTTEELLQHVFISPKTLASYLKTLKENLTHYHLVLVHRKQHYAIDGTEENIRECLANVLLKSDQIHYLATLSDFEKQLFAQVPVTQIYALIATFFPPERYPMSDYNRKNIVLHIALALLRIEEGHVITTKLPLSLPSYNRQLLEQFFTALAEQFAVSIPENEQAYLAFHLFANNKSLISADEQLLQNQATFIRHFLEAIYSNTYIDLRSDSILIEDLFNHLKATAYWGIYQTTATNDFLEDIRATIPLAYDMTAVAAKLNEHILGLHFSSDALTYLALHVAASLERVYSNRWNKPLKAILVCGSGIATTRLLAAKLENQFGHTLELAGNYSYAEFLHTDLTTVDIVISTIPLPDLAIPKLFVSLRTITEDFQKIRQFLTEAGAAVQAIPFFKEDLFFVDPPATNKEELLQWISHQFVQSQLVDPPFYASMMEREKLDPTAIGQGIAIPHPISAQAHQSTIAVCILSKSLAWSSEEQVSVIFCLAISPEEQAQANASLDLFFQLLTDETFKKQMKYCQSYREFSQLIQASASRFH